MHTRVATIQQALVKDHLDALLVTDPANITYLTGFMGLSPTEREAYALVTRTGVYLFTFSTYIDGTTHLSPAIQVRLVTAQKRLSAHLQEMSTAQQWQTIGFEKDNLTVSEWEALSGKMKLHWQAAEQIMTAIRQVKDNQELDTIAAAAQCTDTVFKALLPHIKPGINEWQLAGEIDYQTKQRGDDSAFAPIAAYNAHAAVPHHFPDHQTLLTAGSLILLDFGAKHHGYCADMTRVVFLGKPKADIKKVYLAVLEAQQRVLDYLSHWQEEDPKRVGIEADRIAREVISRQGYSPYQHGLGHGVGLAIHEAPHLHPNASDRLEPGMTVTVEPGIYIPGLCGVRIEDLVVLTKNGIDIVSHTPKDLLVL